MASAPILRSEVAPQIVSALVSGIPDHNSKVQLALDEIEQCIDKFLGILKGTRDNGVVRDRYLRLVEKLRAAHEVVGNEVTWAALTPPEMHGHIKELPFDVVLEKLLQKDEQKVGAYLLKVAFDPDACFAVPEVSGFGCLVASVATGRVPQTEASRFGIIELDNGAAVERQIELSHILRPVRESSSVSTSQRLNRFVNITSEAVPAPFFATRQEVSLPSNRQYFGLSGISVVNPLRGNTLDSTSTQQAGVHGSRLDISSGFGTSRALYSPFAGLYSVSALLSGSARVWIVIPPDQRFKIRQPVSEGVLNFDMDSACSGCQRHQGIFLLPSLLNRHKVKYTQFEHRAGEIVITAPECLVQMYNTGSNVVETSLYGDKHWHPDELSKRQARKPFESCD